MPLSIVIPCYNEAGRLPGTLDDILTVTRRLATPVEIIVVDDGSTDGTAALVETLMRDAPEVRLLRLDRNAGKGAAVRAGMLAARGDRRAFVDADGAVPFEEVARLEAAIDAGADIAVGSRVLDPSRVEALWHRRAIGFVFRRLVRRLAVATIDDTQCGFKLFRAEAAEAVFAEQHLAGFAFDVEVLGRAERLGLRLAEVPVRWREQAGSKVHVVRDGLKMARDVFRLRALLGPPGRPRVAGDRP